MKLVKILSLFTCLAIGDAQAYWGQSYVESFLASMRNFWSKSLQPLIVNPYAYKKEIGIAAAGLGGLGLAGYMMWRYKSQKDIEIAQKIADAKNSTTPYHDSIVVDPRSNITMTIDKQGANEPVILNLTMPGLPTSIPIANPNINMTVDQIRGFMVDGQIKNNVQLAEGISKAPSSSYQDLLLIDPSKKIQMILQKSPGLYLSAIITDGKKFWETTDVEEMKSLTADKIKRLLPEKGLSQQEWSQQRHLLQTQAAANKALIEGVE